MSQGFSKEAVAGELSVNIDTLYEWEKVHPEFSEAIKIGVAKSRFFWEKLGIDHVVGEPFGTKINPAVWIYNMKVRFGLIEPEKLENKRDKELGELSEEELEQKLKEAKKQNG